VRARRRSGRRGRVIGAALRQRVSREKEWGERESEPRERRGWERASAGQGGKESEREGGERRDHVLPQRPRGAEDTFIMHRASEPAEPRGGYRRSTLPRNMPAPRMRRSVRIAASRSSKVARLQPRGDNDDTDLIALIRWIETRAGNDAPFPIRGPLPAAQARYFDAKSARDRISKYNWPH